MNSRLDKKELKLTFENHLGSEFEVEKTSENPFKVNVKDGSSIFVFLKNISPAYFKNKDVTRIQIARTNLFDKIFNSEYSCVPIGYDHTNDRFVVWNPYIFKQRINQKENISVYSRLSKQNSDEDLIEFRLSNNEIVYSVSPNFLGIFLSNINSYFQGDFSKNMNNDFEPNTLYTKNDIYDIKKVNIKQQRGKWDKGYCQHGNDHFIFANVGRSGQGYNENEYNYRNGFDPDGNFEWEAANGSKLRHPSILAITNSSPYVFIRNKDVDKPYWKYIGRARLIEKKEGPPVYVKWEIRDTWDSISELNLPSQEDINISETSDRNNLDGFTTNMKTVFNLLKKDQIMMRKLSSASRLKKLESVIRFAEVRNIDVSLQESNEIVSHI